MNEHTVINDVTRSRYASMAGGVPMAPARIQRDASLLGLLRQRLPHPRSSLRLMTA
jgi:hypothetical protein